MVCDRCGYCCTLRVKLSWLDILRIKKVGFSPKQYLIKDVNNKNTIKLVNGDCFFLERHNNTTFCKIYNHRPKVCRNYPSWNDKEDCVKSDFF